MIEPSDNLISEIAYDSGFENLSHFSRVFKKNYGLAPSGVFQMFLYIIIAVVRGLGWAETVQDGVWASAPNLNRNKGDGHQAFTPKALPQVPTTIVH